jgi:hypothetical protein
LGGQAELLRQEDGVHHPVAGETSLGAVIDRELD